MERGDRNETVCAFWCDDFSIDGRDVWDDVPECFSMGSYFFIVRLDYLWR